MPSDASFLGFLTGLATGLALGGEATVDLYFALADPPARGWALLEDISGLWFIPIEFAMWHMLLGAVIGLGFGCTRTLVTLLTEPCRKSE